MEKLPKSENNDIESEESGTPNESELPTPHPRHRRPEAYSSV